MNSFVLTADFADYADDWATKAQRCEQPKTKYERPTTIHNHERTQFWMLDSHVEEEGLAVS